MTRAAWSLRNRLIALLALLAFVAWAAGSVGLYRSTRQQAGELFDAALVETVHAVFPADSHEGLRKDDDFDFEPSEHVHAERIYYQLRDRRGANPLRVARRTDHGARRRPDRGLQRARGRRARHWCGRAANGHPRARPWL